MTIEEEKQEMESLSETHAGLYLTFALAEEIYGVEILAVQEIMQMTSVTLVPRTPDFVRGVINLRGKVIPVVDLRLKFGMESIEDTTQSCIVVVDVVAQEQSMTMGIVVDRVAEVLDVTAEQIEAPPAFGAAVETNFIRGMGKVGDSVIMLLDIQEVLGRDDMNQISKIGKSKQADKDKIST